MASAYSFIDLAVLDEVRERFARGEALAILSIDLEQVIWANGPGARLFGESDIDAVIDASPQLGAAARRQIMATSGYPDIGHEHGAVVRLTHGVESRTVKFLLSSVRLPDGEPAIALAQPSGQALPELAISGLSGPGQFAALIGPGGQVLTASEGFEALALDAAVLANLASETGPAQRVVKRVIAGRSASFPAGLARLTEDPARFLLIVVDEAGAATAEAGDFEAALREPEVEGPHNEQGPELDDSLDLIPGIQGAVGLDGEGPPQATVAAGPASDPGDTTDAGQPEQQGHEGWYFNAADLVAVEQPLERSAQIDRLAEPVRFVWRTDANGRFSTLSPEFAAAVGGEAAGILGRTFGEVATVFGLDSGHEVAGLLERRDTWSGRTVFWPVAGVALRVPVDLAALPVYSRDREFEGFRGFGVVRLADVVADPEGIGLALVARPDGGTSAAAEPAETEGAPKPSSAHAEDPFQGEVPALALVSKSERRLSDKVIRLAERRQPVPEKGLSPVERSAFREIGERLKKDRTSAKQTAAESEHGQAQTASADQADDTDIAGHGGAPTSEVAYRMPENLDREADDRAVEVGTDSGDGAGFEPAQGGTLREAHDEINPAGVQELTPSELETVRLDPEFSSDSNSGEAKASAGPEPLPGAEVAAGEGGASPLSPAAPAGRRKRRIAFGYQSDVVSAPSNAGGHEEHPGTDADENDKAAGAALNLHGALQAPEAPDADALAVQPEEPSGYVPDREIQDQDSDRPATERATSTDGELAILMAAVSRGDSELANEGSPQTDMGDAPDAASPATDPVAKDTRWFVAEGPAFSVADREDEASAEAGADADYDVDELDVRPTGAPADQTWTDYGRAEESEPVEIARPAIRLPKAEWIMPDLHKPDGSPHSSAARTLGSSDFDSAALDYPEQAGLAFEAQAEGPAAQPASSSEAEPRPEAASQPFADLAAPASAREPLRDQSLLDWSAPRVTGAEKEPLEQRIIDRLPVPILIHAGDVLHYANPEFLYLTGYHTLNDLRAAGGLGALFAERYSGDDDAQDRVLRLRTGDGLEFAIEALLRSVSWNNGTALMLVVKRTGEEASETDDEPREASAALSESHAGLSQATHEATPTVEPAQLAELQARFAEMRTIMDTATDGVVLILPDGTIRSISRPAEALFGFDSAEVEGKPFTSLFAMESQRAARDYLAGLAEHGVASVLNDGREVIGREAEGRFIPLFMTIGKLPDSGGYCAVLRDITQWKRAEEELTQAKTLAERASTQKTEFLARISHEIRTPLNAIIGFSELMMDERFGPVGNDRYRDYLRDINRSGNHVLDLVNDLLDISKIEAGQQEMNYEAVSLNDTLAETVAMMQPQANRERVIIRSSFGSKLPEVVADLRSVRQIALNILSNAIRYTQAGGQVIVSTAYEPSGDVVLRVRDTGIGMTTAEIEQALKPFKQINSLRRGRGDGTGLGLPLTKAMVEANRARFTIASTPGEGTLVEVTFPATRVLAG